MFWYILWSNKNIRVGYLDYKSSKTDWAHVYMDNLWINYMWNMGNTGNFIKFTVLNICIYVEIWWYDQNDKYPNKMRTNMNYCMLDIISQTLVQNIRFWRHPKVKNLRV